MIFSGKVRRQKGTIGLGNGTDELSKTSSDAYGLRQGIRLGNGDCDTYCDFGCDSDEARRRLVNSRDVIRRLGWCWCANRRCCMLEASGRLVGILFVLNLASPAA